MARKSGRGRPRAAQVLGNWQTLARAKVYGKENTKYSDYDIMLRQEYKLACEGHIAAVKIMLRMLDSNLAARDELFPVRRKVRRDGEPWLLREEPRNADLAALILGIASIDDGTVRSLLSYDEEAYEEALLTLAPSRVEPWVYEFGYDEDDEWGSELVEARIKEARTGEWEANKEKILADLMRLRGPGASRFRPGKSGNPKGRPRKKPPQFPYEDFFMETLVVTIHGEKRCLTRLDALMVQLSNLAAKGNEKVRRLILPRLFKLEEAGWKKANVPRAPLVIRY